MSGLLVHITSLPLSMLHVTLVVLYVLHILLKYTSKARDSTESYFLSEWIVLILFPIDLEVCGVTWFKWVSKQTEAWVKEKAYEIGAVSPFLISTVLGIPDGHIFQAVDVKTLVSSRTCPFYTAVDSSQGILLPGVFASWMYFPHFHHYHIFKNQ